MAAPVDSARQGTNITTAATSHAINVGSPVAGTLLIVLVRFAGAPGTVTFTGYMQFAADTSDASDDDTRLYYRQADGSEGATDTLTTTNSIKLAAICWEITGAENPATWPPTVSTVVIGTTANVNPGSVAAESTIYDLLASFSGTASFGSTSAERRAQSIVAGRDRITTVRARIARDSSATDDVICEVQTDSGGSPSETVVASVTVPNALLNTTASEIDFTVNASVTAGNTYWIVFRRSGSLSGFTFNLYPTSGDGYASGGRKFFSSGAWSSLTANDLCLSVKEASVDNLFLTVIGLDSETATATQPAGFSNLASANSGTGGAVATNCMIWGASKQATATSDDPAAWTSSAPNAGVTAWTLAISSPAPAAPTTVRRPYRQSNQVAVMRPSLR